MAHTLAKTFERKGALRDNRSRMMITYTQVASSEDGVYIYQINYDGSKHYTVFICDYYEHGDEAFELWPDEKSYLEGRAMNTRLLKEAKKAYKEFVKINNELLV